MAIFMLLVSLFCLVFGVICLVSAVVTSEEDELTTGVLFMVGFMMQIPAYMCYYVALDELRILI